MTASTSSTLRPTTAGTLVAGFPRGRFSASPGTRVLSFSRASSTISPADALRGPGPLGAREGAGDVAAGRIERSARPLPVAGAGLDQAAQRLVCGAAPRAVLDGHLIARQADRAVDVADGTGPASSRTPYPTAEQAGPQVLRAPVAAALSSPPPDPLPGLAAALRGLTHEAARFPQLIIIYDQIPDRRRGRGFATGIHLNEALEWSKRPGPPHWDATYTVGYDTRALLLEGTNFTLHPAGHHAGYLNFAHPIAVPLPRWKSRWSASYAWNVYMLASYLNYISAYEDRGSDHRAPHRSPFGCGLHGLSPATRS